MKYYLLLAILLIQCNIVAKAKMDKKQIQFGDTFILSSNESSIIGNRDEYIVIEITDFIEEHGYDAPPEDKDRTYFSDVAYRLKVKVKDTENIFSFFSSDIKHQGNFSIEIENYKILVLSDEYNNSSALVEMMINRLK